MLTTIPNCTLVTVTDDPLMAAGASVSSSCKMGPSWRREVLKKLERASISKRVFK
ncbi:MAG: hypothetical protein IPN76_04925 [Saprospiraceae bacterium]|nr:hypothetical protein [Saprospiraceae bacterium]